MHQLITVIDPQVNGDNEEKNSRWNGQKLSFLSKQITHAERQHKYPVGCHDVHLVDAETHDDVQQQVEREYAH